MRESRVLKTGGPLRGSWVRIPPSPPWSQIDRFATSNPEVIDAYTINGARMLYLGDVAGSLEVGKSGDFIVLDRREQVALALFRFTYLCSRSRRCPVARRAFRMRPVIPTRQQW